MGVICSVIKDADIFLLIGSEASENKLTSRDARTKNTVIDQLLYRTCTGTVRVTNVKLQAGMMDDGRMMDGCRHALKQNSNYLVRLTETCLVRSKMHSKIDIKSQISFI